jgi:hypothetical protein
MFRCSGVMAGIAVPRPHGGPVKWRPRLNVTCARCGKPREGIRHDCIASGTRAGRKATVKLTPSFGTCPKCRKPYGLGGPFGHTCGNRGDFRRRKARHDRRQKARARKKRQQEKHDYQACANRDCPRPLCAAFKSGYKLGYDHGVADCPLPRQ